eukprot:514559_1
MIHHLLLAFPILCSIVHSAILTGKNFEYTAYYGIQNDIVQCNGGSNCVVNCYGRYSCASSLIRGPKNKVLTVNCDSWYYAPSSAGGSCYGLTIIANESSSLVINVYQGTNEFVSADVFAPTKFGSGTFGYSARITCGIPGANPPATYQTNCGVSCRVWAVEGWNDVEWTYYWENRGALVAGHASQEMRCGQLDGPRDEYQYKCTKWLVTPECTQYMCEEEPRYKCKTANACDTYLSTTTLPPSGTPSRSPSLMPSDSPTMEPTASTGNPSLSPSYTPSSSPSRSPSFMPSTAPTMFPTYASTDYEDDGDSDLDGVPMWLQGAMAQSPVQLGLYEFLGVVGGILVFICCLLVLCMYCCCCKKKD